MPTRAQLLSVLVAGSLLGAGYLGAGEVPVSDAFFYEVWQTEQGLPHNNVLCVGQRLNGYLWFGTSKGVVRFDGAKMTPFSPPGMPSPPQNEARRMFFDNAGNLWFATQSGELHFLAVTNIYSAGRVERIPAVEGSPERGVYDLCEDNEGGLWVVSEFGRVARWAEGRLKDYGELGQGALGPSGLARDNRGSIWLASRSTLARYQGDSWSPVLKDLAPPLALAARRTGGVWLVAGQSLIEVGSDGVTRNHAQLPWPAHDTEVRQLIEDRHGAVWMATNRRGLLRFSEGKLEIVPVHHPSVLYVLEDAEGSIWYGSQGGGVGRIRERIFEVIGARDGLRNDIVHSIAEDIDGTIWVVSQDGGLACVSNRTCRALGDADGWPNTIPLCVAGARDGSLWIGTLSEGLMRRQNGKFERVPRSPALPGHRINGLLADRDGNVWVGFHGQGISCISTNGVRHFEAGLPGLYITSLAEDAFGHIWAGTGDGGIVRIDHGQVEVVVAAPGRQIVHALLPLEDGTLWYSVSPGGLMRVKEGVRACISRAHGLTDDAIFQIQLDENGWVWCGSGRGLFRVSLRELNDAADRRIPKVSVFAYGRSDGLADFPFYNVAAPATCRSRDGRFWFSSAKGAVAFAPSRLPQNREPPQVFIEGVLADGHLTALREEMQFPPRTRELEIRFAATSFVAPEKVRFRYRLEGTPTDWVETGARPLAVYSGLGPGAYRFQVLACNNDGVWDNQGVSFSFVIPPAFWETRWFSLLAAVVVTGGLAGAFRVATVRRLRRRLARLHEQHALEQERIRIAHDIHDELGASLTQIGMLASFARQNTDRPAELASDLEKITETAHEAVRAMDAIVWAINPQNDSLENFAAYVSKYAENFLRPAGIRFRFDAPGDLPAQPLGTEQRHQLFLTVREALNNVVRHSQCHEVWLRLAVDKSWFLVSVEDDGHGLPAGGAGPGSDGLISMRERITAVGGRFSLTSQSGKGTLVKIAVPIKPAADLLQETTGEKGI